MPMRADAENADRSSIKTMHKETPPLSPRDKAASINPSSPCANLLYPTIIVKSFPVYGSADVDTN